MNRARIIRQLRFPKDILRKLNAAAKEKGISPNMYAVSLIATALEEKKNIRKNKVTPKQRIESEKMREQQLARGKAALKRHNGCLKSINVSPRMFGIIMDLFSIGVFSKKQAEEAFFSFYGEVLKKRESMLGFVMHSIRTSPDLDLSPVFDMAFQAQLEPVWGAMREQDWQGGKDEIQDRIEKEICFYFYFHIFEISPLGGNGVEQ